MRQHDRHNRALWYVALMVWVTALGSTWSRAADPPEAPATSSTSTAAQDPSAAIDKVLRENQALRQRVASLEKQVGQLVTTLTKQSEDLAKTKEAQDKLAGKNELIALQKELAKDAGRRDHRPNLWANLDIQVYGKIKADAAFDTARTSTGNFARWVESEETNSSDHTFNATAKETRLGLRLTGPEAGGIKTSGVLEIDFWGGGAENKANPMMRHAFVKIDWVQCGLSLLAGQTWDVISPQNPSTLNYPVQWWAGNIGYRRPQIRLTKVWDLGGGRQLTVAGALARAIGHNSGFDPGDTGEDSGLPCFQARAAISWPLAGRKAVFGVSGHYAQEEYDTDAAGHHTNACSWSGNVDFVLPVAPWLTVKGEAFTGQNIDAYLGGIGQGIVVAGTSLQEIRSAGGWVAASMGPWDKWSFTIGCSGEFICNEDILAAGARTCNSAIFGNVIYSLNDHTKIGVEVSRWLTKYKDLADGDSLRVQTSFIYSF